MLEELKKWYEIKRNATRRIRRSEENVVRTILKPENDVRKHRRKHFRKLCFKKHYNKDYE